MNESSHNNPEYQELSDPQFHEIDELCDRFDRELINGRSPRIEPFMENAPGAIHEELLAELLAMELDFRVENCEAPDQKEYCQRFPEHEGTVMGVFAGHRKQRLPVGNETILHDGVEDSDSYDVPPQLDNYRLIEKIGSGGMGVIWRAEQVHPVKRQVAIKLIKSELSSREILARFDTEKQVLALMDHPNIARVLDAGTTLDDRPFVVMELVEGAPLTQYCDENKLTVDERLKLFVPVCNAVQHAHQKGIIHRDLKPSNVLITVIDGEAIPKVIDFGLAKAVERQPQGIGQSMLTEFGKVVGTVQYMSPEQAGLDAQDIDTRTDIYSLGVILYELLTGSTPLEKDQLVQNAMLKILEIIREENPPRPSNRLSSSAHSVNSEVSGLRRMQPARLQKLLQGELDWVVMKALEKNRSHRYQTANDFAQDLSNYLSGEMVLARPPSTWYQLKKFARRNRGLVAAMSAVAIALLVGIAGTTYGLLRANQKSILAEEKTNEAVEAREVATAESKRARDMEAEATFQLAIARFDDGHSVESRNLLHQIPEEYRDNFEWNYCNRRFQGSDITCYGHANAAQAVAFFPKGINAISAGDGGTIRIWDTTTGREINKFEGHEGRVFSLAISPDGSLIASAGQSGLVNVWDVGTGKIVRTMTGHTGPINRVAFDPTGDRIVSASDDKTIKVWDTETGKGISNISGHTAAVKGVAYSPDGKQLASVGLDKLIRIWDARSGKAITELRKHRSDVNNVAFSPDGTRLVAGSYSFVSLWNARNWQFIAESGSHDGHVRCVSFSPDGTRFATGGEDSNIHLWDSQSGKKIMDLNGHGKPVWGVAFSPDGSRLVSASKDKTIKIWNTNDGCDIALRGHTGHVTSIAFSSDGKQLASGGQGGVIILWDGVTLQERFRLKGHPEDVDELQFSPDGKRLASGSGDSTIRVWNTETGAEIAVLKGHVSWVRGVAFSPDGTQIASAGRDGTVRLWDANEHKETAALKGHRGDVYCVAFSPDGSCVASGGLDRTIKLWNAKTGEEIRTLVGQKGRVRSLAFGPRGEQIVSAGYDSKARLWDVSTGQQITTCNLRPEIAFGVALSPGGSHVATVGANSMSLFNASSGREIMKLDGGSSEVAFSPNGKQLAATTSRRGDAFNGTVRIWRAPQNHENSILAGHTDDVTAVTFSADGLRLYSESEKEKLVWDVETRSSLPGEAWQRPEETILSSPSGRWWVTTESNNVVLVDLEFKNTPNEKTYRSFKSQFDSVRHQESAAKAIANKNWFAATFHYAWLLKTDPEQATYFDNLQSSFKELESQRQEFDSTLHLNSVIEESLKIPRGNKQEK